MPAMLTPAPLPPLSVGPDSGTNYSPVIDPTNANIALRRLAGSAGQASMILARSGSVIGDKTSPFSTSDGKPDGKTLLRIAVTD